MEIIILVVLTMFLALCLCLSITAIAMVALGYRESEIAKGALVLLGDLVQQIATITDRLRRKK